MEVSVQKNRGIVCAVSFLLVFFISTNAFAQTRYVSGSGNDSSNDCTVSGSPCATIQAAVDVSIPGDSILVSPGVYSHFAVGLGQSSRLNIKATGSVQIKRAYFSTLERVVDLRADSISFEGFTVKGGGTHVGISVSGIGSTIKNNAIDSVLTGIQTTTQNTAGNTTITGNTVSNSGYGISLQNNSNSVSGNNIAVTTEGFGVGSASNTITGNDLEISSGGVQVQTYSGGSLPGADIDLLAFLSNNTLNKSVIVKDDSGLKIGTIFGDIQDAIESASKGDTVKIGVGEYSENLTISTSDIKLIGAQFGVDARNRTASESKLTGSITINGTADSLLIDGLTIEEGASTSGENAGIYINKSTTHTTIQNTIFYRSGTVDGDTYRGIVSEIDGLHTDLLIQKNDFKGWATGVYLNPGPNNTSILNNDFDNNYVGMSFDGPDGVTISGNTFKNNVFEGLGFGPWTSSEVAPANLTATVTTNDFDNNTTHLGLYLGTSDTIDISGNSFAGVNVSSMSVSELLAAEEKIGHVVDVSGGYSGFARLKNMSVFITSGNSITTGLNYTTANDTLYIGNGTYDLSTSQLLVNTDDIALIGESEAGVIIDATDVPSSAGVLITSDGVTVQRITVHGPTANTFGLKFSPTTDDSTKSYFVKNVTVTGSGRTELDIIGIAGAVVDSVTLNGNDTGGVGIAITDSRNIELRNITTLGNQWGGIGIFTAGRFADGGTSNITLSGTNSLGETNPIYAENDIADDDTYYTITDLTLNGYEYTVQNNSFRSDATEFTFFQSSESNAISYALSLSTPDSSIIRQNASGAVYTDTDGDVNLDADGAYIVGYDNSTPMSIIAALGVVTDEDSIKIRSGVYTDSSIVINKEKIAIEISTGASGIDSVNLGSTIKEFRLIGNDSSLVLIGNSQDNIFNLSGSANIVDGGTGTDQIVLSGNRHEYTLTDNSSSITLSDTRTNTPNGNNTVTNVEQAVFDNTTISLSIGKPITYPGTSIDFPNNSTQIEIPNDAAIQLIDSLTIEFWIKADGFDTADQNIIQKGNTSWSIHRNASTNSIAFTTFISTVSHTLEGTVSINDTKWHHIAAVFTGSTKLLYVDGMLDSQASVSGSLDSNTDPITIGGWEGNMDELRIWNRTRSSENIRTNVFQPLAIDEIGLVGYWRMDEGSGSLISDLTSNKNDISIDVSSSLTWSSETYPTGSFITGDEGWRLITSPSNGLSYAQILEGVWTQGFTGADTESGTSNVYTYSEGDGGTDASGRGFSSIPSASSVPSEGQAILVYVYEDDDPGTGGIQGGFPKTLKSDSTQRFGTVNPSLSLTKSGAGGIYEALNDGWNLVGNPYASTVNWDENSGWTRTGLDDAMYVWSDSASGGTGAYLSWNGVSGTLGSGKISPMQGFWVKANNTGTPSLAIDDTARSSGAVLLKSKLIPELRFNLVGEKLANKSIIMFSEESDIGKDNLDAYKLGSNNTNWLSISTSVSEEVGSMDIQSLPIQFEEPIEMSLDIDGSDLNGEFNLSWNSKHIPEYLNIKLWDQAEEKAIDLSGSGSYQFILDTKAKSEVGENSLHLPSAVVPQPILRKESALSSRFIISVRNLQTSTDETDNEIPALLELSQNYPNPFNPNTMIEFGLPGQSKVTLEVFDILGRKVATLLNNELRKAGWHRVGFDAAVLSSGIYLYRISMNDSQITMKMTVLK